jgi:hypothetical protein
MHSLQDVFKQAKDEDYAVTLNGAGYKYILLHGIQIVKDDKTDEVQIINTHKGGEYYTALSDNECSDFISGGWRYGVYILVMSNYLHKLDIIENRIKIEIQEKSGSKQVLSLKSERSRILDKYSKINFKLNQIKSKSNGNIKKQGNNL